MPAPKRTFPVARSIVELMKVDFVDEVSFRCTLRESPFKLGILIAPLS